MRLVVITPVGPGHEAFARKAAESVRDARRNQYGFSTVRHILVHDHHGKLGRSKARNIGMVKDADWYFFLDADDQMRPDAMTLNDFSAPATFGAISLNSKVLAKNVFPCGWHEVVTYGARGTLSMGCFVNAHVARTVRFNEDIDAGEDFDFYMRLPGFTKIDRPLVNIGYDLPSAGGPRGYNTIDWVGICDAVIRKAYAKEPKKYALGGHAILEKAGNPQPEPQSVPQPVPH